MADSDDSIKLAHPQFLQDFNAAYRSLLENEDVQFDAHLAETCTEQEVRIAIYNMAKVVKDYIDANDMVALRVFESTLLNSPLVGFYMIYHAIPESKDETAFDEDTKEQLLTVCDLIEYEAKELQVVRQGETWLCRSQQVKVSGNNGVLPTAFSMQSIADNENDTLGDYILVLAQRSQACAKLVINSKVINVYSDSDTKYFVSSMCLLFQFPQLIGPCLPSEVRFTGDNIVKCLELVATNAGEGNFKLSDFYSWVLQSKSLAKLDGASQMCVRQKVAQLQQGITGDEFTAETSVSPAASYQAIGGKDAAQCNNATADTCRVTTGNAGVSLTRVGNT